MVSTVFPHDFLWGAATSAFQVEGAYNETNEKSQPHPLL